MICINVPSDTHNLVMFKVLNLVKCLIVAIQSVNNINSEIYRHVVLSHPRVVSNIFTYSYSDYFDQRTF